jgi:hypothetical protein
MKEGKKREKKRHHTLMALKMKEMIVTMATSNEPNAIDPRLYLRVRTKDLLTGLSRVCSYTPCD